MNSIVNRSSQVKENATPGRNWPTIEEKETWMTLHTGTLCFNRQINRIRILLDRPGYKYSCRNGLTFYFTTWQPEDNWIYHIKDGGTNYFLSKPGKISCRSCKTKILRQEWNSNESTQTFESQRPS